MMKGILKMKEGVSIVNIDFHAWNYFLMRMTGVVLAVISLSLGLNQLTG